MIKEMLQSRGLKDRKMLLEQKQKVLFVCNHNSARSQMAEMLLNHLAGDRFTAMSAGLEPRDLNPLAVAVMREIGLDMSSNVPKSIVSLYKRGESFRYQIMLCDEEGSQCCPTYPGIIRQYTWCLDNPANAEGTDEDKLQAFRKVRDAIRLRIDEWIETA